jgi:hypothetical protein
MFIITSGRFTKARRELSERILFFISAREIFITKLLTLGHQKYLGSSKSVAALFFKPQDKIWVLV